MARRRAPGVGTLEPREHPGKPLAGGPAAASTAAAPAPGPHGLADRRRVLENLALEDPQNPGRQILVKGRTTKRSELSPPPKTKRSGRPGSALPSEPWTDHRRDSGSGNPTPLPETGRRQPVGQPPNSNGAEMNAVQAEAVDLQANDASPKLPQPIHPKSHRSRNIARNQNPPTATEPVQPRDRREPRDLAEFIETYREPIARTVTRAYWPRYQPGKPSQDSPCPRCCASPWAPRNTPSVAPRSA